MPPTSKAQARFMRAVESGSIKKPGLSPAKAKEFLGHTPTKKLPNKAKKK